MILFRSTKWVNGFFCFYLTIKVLFLSALCFPFGGARVDLNNQPENKGRFFIYPPKNALDEAANFTQDLPSRKGTLPMTARHTLPQSEKSDNLSAQLDHALSQVEYFQQQVRQGTMVLSSNQEALVHWRNILHRLQANIPIDDPFKDFLDTLGS